MSVFDKLRDVFGTHNPWMFRPFNQNTHLMCPNDLIPLITCCSLMVLRSFVMLYYYWSKWCLLLFIHNQCLYHWPWIFYTPAQLYLPWGSSLGSLLNNTFLPLLKLFCSIKARRNIWTSLYYYKINGSRLFKSNMKKHFIISDYRL